MAPSFEQLGDEENYGEDDLDFSDLQARFDVRLEEGLDAFVVVDGLPVVPEDSKAKLIKFILRKMADVGTSREDQVRMPLNSETSMTEGYAFIEFEDASQAAAVVKKHHNTPLDRKHIMKINKLTDIEHYGREGRIDDEYQAPDIAPFQPREHQREWLKDPEGRDQFIAFRGEEVGIYWNEQEGEPEKVVERKGWTDTFAQWSPLGTYLTTMHAQGVQLWSGKSWGRKKILHPGVDLIDYSPDERFLITWSHLPLEVSEGNPVLSAADDGKNYIIWDLATELPIRSFVTLDPPGSHEEHKDLSVPPPKKKLQWPAFKWSCDSKYVARLTQAQSGGPYTSISVYELPGMGLLDKTSIKIEGVADFEWCPALPQRDSVRSYEQLFCYWTPELGSNPAKVGLMSIPSKEVVRTQNLFNVMDAKLHWQSESAFVCVKVDRHSKSKKFLATVLEIFRVKEKGLPVEVIDTIKDTVINFAWEPQGDRFVLITAGEMVEGATVPPKTAVSFYCPEKARANTVGNFKLIRTEEKKNNNAIHWSPRGRFVVVSTVLSQQSFDLNFWDLDYEGDKDEKDKDLTANLQLVATAHHYGVTDIEWDPSGRFVATSVSIWKHRMENGYHLYDFKGTLLREDTHEAFKQWAWRPRPERLLTKEEQKNVRRNLREYSRQFEEQDMARKSTANKAVVEERRRQLNEWLAWRRETEDDLRSERQAADLDPYSEEQRALFGDDTDGERPRDDSHVVEEIVEEILEESEEIVTE